MTERMALSELQNNLKNLIFPKKKRQIIKFIKFVNVLKNVPSFFRDTRLKKIYRQTIPQKPSSVGARASRK